MYDDQNRTDFFTLNQSLTQWLNIELGYDSLDRLSGRIVNLNGFSYTEQYSYESVTGTGTSSFVSMHTVNGVEYNYVYDSVGNITAVYKDLVRVASYSYDKLGQLTMAFLTADDGTQDVYEYYYDKSGNITNALRHRGDTTQESQYTYGNATWGDLLTKYNGVNISYDAIGNPINWRNAGSLMWQGRRLALFSHINGEQYMYTYNSDGIRTGKQIRNADNALITGVEYIYDGSKLVAESRNGEWLFYAYDETGAIAGVSYNGVLYLFRKNLQGDVTGIYNANGALIAEYSYTPYGAMLAITDANGNDISGNSTHIANINPIRYRGYYYDTETGFYYLQTRYYDPTVGRFINADAIIGINDGILGHNLFTYCLNNPINKADYGGNKPEDLFDTMDEAAKDAAICLGDLSFENGWEYITVIYSVYTLEITFKAVKKTYWFLWWSWTEIKIVPIPTIVKKYTYKAVKTNKDPWSVSIPQAPMFKKRLATVHTHPMGSGMGITRFSEGDINTANDMMLIDYVYGPNGEMRKYDPSTGEDILIFSDLPVSSKKPWLS